MAGKKKSGASPRTSAKPAGKSKPTPEELLSAARATLEQEGVVKQTALGPVASRGELVAQLVQEGYEAGKSIVRKPISAQLRAVLENGAFISLKSVGSHVVGASATEVQAVARTLVESGEAKLVQRGTAEVLVPPSTAVIARAELVRFADFAKFVAKVASSRSNAGLLRADFLEELERVLPSGRAATTDHGRAKEPEPEAEPEREPERQSAVARATPGEAPLQAQLAQLLAAVEERRDPATGLSFVPEIVATLRGQLAPEVTREALLAAAKEGLLELRPEGGIRRLSEEELSQCPPGPQGTRLSWARRTEEAVR